MSRDAAVRKGSMYQMFGFLATPLGYVVEFIYNLLSNYGWALILFTLIIRVVLFPLALRQQKSTARMGAYQPLIQEIQKKWANDRNRQTQEVQKFYQENNIKMTPGCLPMLINLIVLFGIIAVIQAPLQYIVHMPEDQIANGVAIVQQYDQESGISGNTYTQQSILIGEIKSDPELFEEGVEIDGKTVKVEKEWVTSVTNFNFEFLGLDLSKAPKGFNVNLILPILSVLTMLGSQVIIMKFSGQGAAQGKATMWIMTLVMGVMFAVFAFRIPIGFSLYYTASNVIMTIQQLIVKRIHNPDKIREELLAEVEARKKAKNEKKKVAKLVVADSSGEKRELTESEAVRLRLEHARKMDALKYGEGGEEDGDSGMVQIEAREIEEDTEPEPTPEQVAEEETEAPPQTMPEEQKPEYKPGRRRKASQKKATGGITEEDSFADEEMKAEKSRDQKEGLENA